MNKILLILILCFNLIGCSSENWTTEYKKIYTNEMCFNQCQMDNPLNCQLGIYNVRTLQCYQICDFKKEK